MQLQKQLSRKHKDKLYPKYTVVISPKDIEELGWKEGIELIPIIKNKKLVLEPKE